ncbi:hypothetical protein V8D89_009416 [Ganoderma adspersum]
MDCVVQRVGLGAWPVHAALLGDSYLVVTPLGIGHSKLSRCLSIHGISPSIHNCPICMLQWPDDINLNLNLNPGEHIVSFKMVMSQSSFTPGGHFCADPSQSMVILTYKVRTRSDGAFTDHFLIPYMTILTQIHAVASRRGDAQAGDQQGTPDGPPVLVPWEDWGPYGCLRLRLQDQGLSRVHHVHHVIPFSSRMPVLVYHDSDFQNVTVYVFDINPLAARCARALAARGEATQATAIVEDVEEALPGVVDPECLAILYVVYCFPLPPPSPERGHWHPIWSIEMTMTGFALPLGGGGYPRSLQT